MRDFFKYTAATLLGLLLFLGVGLGGILWLIIASAGKDAGPQVKNGSILVFDLSMDITDAPPETSLGKALQSASSGEDNGRSVTLRTALQAIDAAAKDPKITGLYLTGSMDRASRTGFATLKEVREALERFRNSGKKIIAYGVDWREKEYYLGSVANTIAINPIGSFELNGLSSEPTFYAGALQKFGVGIQVTRVGKYKSAVEPLLLTKMSPENREQLQALLGDLWSEVLTATGKDRQIAVPQLQAIADRQGILEPSDALAAKLVDKVAYTDEITADLKALASKEKDDQGFRQISLKSYANISADSADDESQDHVAVIYAEGEIVAGRGDSGQVGGDRFAEALRKLRENDKVKAVVLRINSPGGSVTGSDVIQREVMLTRKVKPVVVSMGTVAASGGYWIATYSDRIFAEPNTITGSIGVFGIQPNFQQIANQNGITWDTVKTGRYADLSTTTRPKSPQELALVQKSVDLIYDQFLTKVAESRKLPKTKVGEIAQGRVWSGAKAKELGLVDELGGLEAAIREAATRAKLGTKFRVQEYPRSRSLEERILQQLQGDSALGGHAAAQPDPLTREVKKMQRDLAALQAMNDPRGIYVRLPINFRVE